MGARSWAERKITDYQRPIYFLMIPADILKSYGAHLISLPKGTFLFKESSKPVFYYQVHEGKIKMANQSYEGKEFVQGFFSNGESFGEPPLFGTFNYPGSAIAVEDSKIWRLEKNIFLELLRNNFDLHYTFTQTLAKRLFYKAMQLREISSHDPEHRIITLIDYLRAQENNTDRRFRVKLTRQQLADLTGLRVETVIRSVKKLESRGLVIIDGGIVFRLYD